MTPEDMGRAQASRTAAYGPIDADTPAEPYTTDAYLLKPEERPTGPTEGKFTTLLMKPEVARLLPPEIAPGRFANFEGGGQAEERFRKAIEVKPEDAGAYNGLATVYNAQRKFDLMEELGARALCVCSSVAEDSTGDLDHLLLGGAKLANRCGRHDVEVE